MSGRIISIERRRVNRLALSAQTDEAQNQPTVQSQAATPSSAKPTDPATPATEGQTGPRPDLRGALEARRIRQADASMRHRVHMLQSRVDPASSLRDEVLGDGKANCLERAVGLAKTGDDVVLLNDSRDDSGHAVVRHADGTVSDPNSPDTTYDSLEAYQEKHSQYGDPVALSDTQAEAVLRTPPGAERDALIQSMGLDGIADRRVADIFSGIDDIRIPAPTPPKPAAATPKQQAASIEAAVKPQIEDAREAQVAADSAEGFADWAVADAASLGIDGPTQAKVEEEANTVRREKLPGLKQEAEDKTQDANRALATETLEQLGIDPTEEGIAAFSGALGEASSEEERQQILEGTVDAHHKQQTYDEVSSQVDGWVNDTFGDQGALVDREDLLLDMESMVVSGMSSTEIEESIRGRLENVRTRGLDSISGGTFVEGFSEADVINAGLRIDSRDREETQRQVLDTLQVTLGVGSDEALADRLGIDVDQLGNTQLVRNVQNAGNPEDIIAELQADPQYQVNLERRRLTDLATNALADGGSLGISPADMGLEGVTDMTTIGEIIDNSSGVDAALTNLGQSLGPDGEAITVNLTQQQRNDLALERGFLRRNGYNDEEINEHLTIRGNTLHWQNESKDEIAEWAAQGVIPEFGYDSLQSGQVLDFENNAARTAWALDVAGASADDINAQQADDIGATRGVQDATRRLQEHWMTEEPTASSGVVGALHYTFGGGTSYTEALNRLQENPSVDEIQEFRDNIDEVLNNDTYHLSDDSRAMLEASMKDFDEALAGAQDTRDGARNDINLARAQLQYQDMLDEFENVNTDGVGFVGQFNRAALDYDGQFLGVHADATEEEITAFEVLASIPEEQRTSEQKAAYSVLAQGLLGTNHTTGTEGGYDRFDQGGQLAEDFEAFINDGTKQNIVLGSAIVGTGVSFLNPVAGGVIIVGGTGVGLGADKLTGNEDLTWGEVGLETGISLGSVGTGFGVSRLARGGSRLLAPTTRGGRVAFGGGTFLAEEVVSDGVITTGSALARGEDITAGTFLDPVGLLYGLPFAAGDARRIIGGAPRPGINRNNSPDTPNYGAGQQPPPVPHGPEHPYNTLYDSASPAAQAELGQLNREDLQRLFPNGAYPNSVLGAAEIPGFANLVKTDPAAARGLIDARHFYGDQVNDSFTVPNNNGAALDPATVALWNDITPSYTQHPNDPTLSNPNITTPGFVVGTAGQNRQMWMPEFHIAATNGIDHNGALSQPAATGGSTNLPNGIAIRPENIMVNGQPMDNLDGVAVFGAHGGKDQFGGASTEQAADMMFRSISDSAANPNNPRSIDSVVLEACNQRNCRLDLQANGTGLVRSNARDFERILNDKLRAAGMPEVSVFAASHNGVTFGGPVNYQSRRPPTDNRPAAWAELESTTFLPASAFPRPYPSTVRNLRNGAVGLGAVGAGGAYIYTQVTDDE